MEGDGNSGDVFCRNRRIIGSGARNKTWCPSKIVIVIRLLVNTSGGREMLILLFGCAL